MGISSAVVIYIVAGAAAAVVLLAFCVCFKYRRWAFFVGRPQNAGAERREKEVVQTTIPEAAPSKESLHELLSREKLSPSPERNLMPAVSLTELESGLMRSAATSPTFLVSPERPSALSAGLLKNKPPSRKWKFVGGGRPSSFDDNHGQGHSRSPSQVGQGQGDGWMFSYKELSRATNGFDRRNEIGVGGLGKVYKGFLDNKYIAMKKMAISGSICQELAEVSITERMRGLSHPNLVPLLGWCQEKGEMVLVYHYFPRGSLDRILHSTPPAQSNPLLWEQRRKIISGVASALAFLHTGWLRCIVHGDVKSSNILIDDDQKAVLGDFGLPRRHHLSPEPSPGYLASEHPTAAVSDKTDVYSFGVVVLEVVTGRSAIDHHLLTDWVWSLHLQGRIHDAADPRLAPESPRPQLNLLLELGLHCTFREPSLRPRMPDVVQVLEGRSALPALPSRRP